MKIPRNAIVNVCELVLGKGGARSATKFLSPDMRVTATSSYPHDGRMKTDYCLLTIGKPNYAQRQFVKNCKISGEPFPVRKIQIKWWK